MTSFGFQQVPERHSGVVPPHSVLFTHCTQLPEPSHTPPEQVVCGASADVPQVPLALHTGEKHLGAEHCVAVVHSTHACVDEQYLVFPAPHGVFRATGEGAHVPEPLQDCV